MASMSAKSAEELRAEIEATRRRAEAEEARLQELQAETEQARERQRLRKELRKVRRRLREAEDRNSVEMILRQDIDHERPWLASQQLSKRQRVMQASGGESTKFDHMVARGEYVWRIEGFSWVPCSLEQDEAADCDRHWVEADTDFHLGDETFSFRYSCENKPGGEYRGPLAIMLCSEERIALRYGIYVRGRNGEFVQWSQTRKVIHHGDVRRSAAYGPADSRGIFGLSHEELLQSEWVENDTLTVKFELEVRPHEDEQIQPLIPAAEVPEPTILDDTRALLEEGTCSDVRFMVQGEEIEAHSQILCARSEFFKKQLTAGMQESISKVIVIEDCDVATFKAFLQFLYTDQLPDAQEVLQKGTSHNNETESRSRELSRIQALLAVSHKYQVTRLQLWCEAKLSEQVDASQVCGILCQAHILQAKQLEKIGVKVSLFSAGVPVKELSTTMDGTEKRPVELEIGDPAAPMALNHHRSPKNPETALPFQARLFDALPPFPSSHEEESMDAVPCFVAPGPVETPRPTALRTAPAAKGLLGPVDPSSSWFLRLASALMVGGAVRRAAFGKGVGQGQVSNNLGGGQRVVSSVQLRAAKKSTGEPLMHGDTVYVKVMTGRYIGELDGTTKLEWVKARGTKKDKEHALTIEKMNNRDGRGLGFGVAHAANLHGCEE
ncbi:BPM1 [Symbiodinium sp. KB8]|nr:BPM1 [Symbiodinium sp. KB8]